MLNVGNLTAANPSAQGVVRYVIGPLAAQTISGTVKVQMRGSESNAGANATGATAIKIIKPDGTDRSVLLAQTASDSATVGNEFKTSLTNATFKNVAEIAAMILTPQTSTAGDYLVIELGFRSATTTPRTVNLSYGDNSSTDLPEDTTTTTANNPWVEFSADIPLLHTGSSAPTIGAATCAGAATASAAVYIGTAADTVGAATCAGSATFVKPVYTAAAAVTVGAATASAAATFATNPHPVVRITQAHLQLSGRRYGSFGGKSDTFNATAAVTVGAATASASGQFGHHPVVRITQAHLDLSGRRYGSFADKAGAVPGVHRAVATIIGPAALAAGTASFLVPAITASADITLAPVTVSISGQFGLHPVAVLTQMTMGGALPGQRYGSFALKGVGPVVAAGNAVTAAATASGTAALTPPVYTAAGDATAPAATSEGFISFTGQEYTGDAIVIIGAATAAGSAAFTVPVYTATAAITVGAVVGAGFVLEPHTASIDVSIGEATASGFASFTSPIYAAVGAVTTGAATAEGSAATFATHPVGRITQPHYHLSGKRYRSFSGKRREEAPTGTGEHRQQRAQERQQRVKRRREREAVELVLMGML